jgi:GDP-L-fucose synthase
MTIAVVGAYGFIGSNLCAGLLARNQDIRCIGRYDSLDFGGCSLVYHVAGVTGGGQLLARDPLAMVGANLRIALDVFDAALADGVEHVIAMSSTTPYPDDDHPMREEEYWQAEIPAIYRNPGETRRFIEKLARMYPFRTTFLRCAGAYGPGDDYDWKTSHVIGATIRKVAERHDPIICWGDGLDERDGTYIDDLVEALIAAQNVPGTMSFNIGTGRTISINRMIEVLCAHAGYKPRIEYDHDKPRMIRRRLLDVSMALGILKWTARIPMEQGLCYALDAYASQ